MIRYIKEFVHGDFGRTKPSLGTLLNTTCDILELNVEVSYINSSFSFGIKSLKEGSLQQSPMNKSYIILFDPPAYMINYKALILDTNMELY